MAPQPFPIEDADPRRLPRTEHIVIDAEHFDRTMGLLITAIQELRDTQAAAVATGIGSVATNRELVAQVMTTVADVAQKRAAEATGRGLWWLLRNGLSKWLVISFIVFLVFKAAGIDAARAVARLLTGGTP